MLLLLVVAVVKSREFRKLPFLNSLVKRHRSTLTAVLSHGRG